MKGRHLVAQLQRRHSPWGLLDMTLAGAEISRLARDLENPDIAKHGLCQLVPIRVIACVEGCLKSATASLINHGEPYLANAQRLFQQVKIDFDVLRAVLDESVSLGDIVAHSLTWHDLTEINARMSALLGFDFFEKLATVKDRWAVEINRRPNEPIIVSLKEVLAGLSDAMRTRHILCHEVASFEEISQDDAKRFARAGKQFAGATSWLISEVLHPNAPLTQSDMTEHAWRRAQAAEDQLNQVIAEFLKILDTEDSEIFSRSHEHWRAFRDAHSQLEGHAAKGGSMSPQLRGLAFERVTRNRILEIRDTAGRMNIAEL